jgi:hypothetical protein
MINHDQTSFVMITSGVSHMVSFTVHVVNGRLTSSLQIRKWRASRSRESPCSAPWRISRQGNGNQPSGRLRLLLLQQTRQELRNGTHA